jgi:Scaffold protein Nfu/NifU N terminal
MKGELSTGYDKRNSAFFQGGLHHFCKNPNLTLELKSSVDIFYPHRRLAVLPFRVTEVQPTPNPNAVKLILDRVIADCPISFLNPESGKEHPIASRLFAINGVTGLLLLGDFVTVTKTPEARWADITKKVEQALAAA